MTAFADDTGGEVTGDDVRAAATAFLDALEPALSADWTVPAGTLTWTCGATLAHVADCALWYALNLGGRTRGPDAWEWADTPAEPVPAVLSIIRPSAEVLAAVVDAAPADARGWHPWGIADRSGFAAMGCDEILLHGSDVAAGLGVGYNPPAAVCARVVRRLFPWSPAGHDPWSTLLWANGRADLDGCDPIPPNWRWHCRPLAEWNGTPPARGKSTRR